MRDVPLTASFDIRADRDADVPCRVLGHFARLGKTPSRVQIRAVGDELFLRIVQGDIGEHAAEVIAAKLRALVTVRAVLLEHQIGPGVLRSADADALHEVLAA